MKVKSFFIAGGRIVFPRFLLPTFCISETSHRTLTFIPQKLEESEEVLAALTNSNFGKLTIFQDQSSETAASKKKVGCARF